MMEMLKPPGPMDFKPADVADAWDKWDRRFRNYFKVAELKKKDRDVQVAIRQTSLLQLAMLIKTLFFYKKTQNHQQCSL